MHPPKPLLMAAQPAVAAEAAHKLLRWLLLVAVQQAAVEAEVAHKLPHRPLLAAAPPVAAVAAMHRVAAHQAAALAAPLHKSLEFPATFWVASLADSIHLAH